MDYTTPAEVRSALSPMADPDQEGVQTGTAADLSDTQLQDAIEEAMSFIDTYIGTRYVVPVAPVNGTDSNGQPIQVIPHPIDFWCRNIAAYNATLAYRGSQDFAESDPVARRYAATFAALQQVAAGTATLSLPENTGGTATDASGSPVNPYSGEMFSTDEFDLVKVNPGWPTIPDFMRWGGTW